MKLSKEQQRVVQRSHISDILDGTETNDIDFSAKLPEWRRRRKHLSANPFEESEL